MKQCAWCKQVKSDSDFRREPRMTSGLTSYCVDCIRVKGREQKRRKRMREGPEETRRKWNDWYSRNAEYRSRYTQGRKDPKKTQAQNKVNKAVMYGRLMRPSYCENCRETCKPDAHHDDYSEPLKVRWLCRKCHRVL